MQELFIHHYSQNMIRMQLFWYVYSLNVGLSDDESFSIETRKQNYIM